MQTIAAYIPVFNGAQYLQETLESIFNQTIPFASVTVIDDGSTDNLLSIVKKFPVQLIVHGSNRGIGAARKSALRNINDPFVAAIDCDCILERDWLAQCMPYFDDENVAGVGGMMQEEENLKGVDLWRAINLKQHFGETTKKVEFLAGSNTIFRLKDIEEIGGYDQTKRRYHEDTELCSRLRANGKDLIYCAEARVTHIKRDSLYTVMRTCWGFRHCTFPKTLSRVFVFIGRDMIHNVSIILKTIKCGRWSLLWIDSCFIFMQSLFTIKAWIQKRIDFD